MKADDGGGQQTRGLPLKEPDVVRGLVRVRGDAGDDEIRVPGVEQHEGGALLRLSRVRVGKRQEHHVSGAIPRM